MGTLNAYILLDRTGSMRPRWDEALSAVNAYVDELAKQKTKARVTAAAFDEFQGLQFDVLRDSVAVGDWQDLTDRDAMPRGATPLLDALGRAITLAEEADKKRTVIVVMTDGEENSSSEMTKASAKAAIDRCQKRGWQVLFLGTDFDAFAEARGVGVGQRHTIMASAANYSDTMRAVGTKTVAYAATGAAMGFDNKDREEAVR